MKFLYIVERRYLSFSFTFRKINCDLVTSKLCQLVIWIADFTNFVYFGFIIMTKHLYPILKKTLVNIDTSNRRSVRESFLLDVDEGITEV